MGKMPPVNASQGAEIRKIFNQIGYKHPNTKVSQNYNLALNEARINLIDPINETVILHIGVGKALQDGIRAVSLTFQSTKGSGWNATAGQLLLTNLRVIALQFSGGLFSQKSVSGYQLSWTDIARCDPTDYKQYTDIGLYTREGEYHLRVQFVSAAATAMQVLQVVSALNQPRTSQIASLGYVADKQRTEAQTNAYINANLAKAGNLKQTFVNMIQILSAPA